MKCARRAISAMTAPHSPVVWCQIPPPSRYSNSNALDDTVRKPGETPALYNPPRPQLTDHRKDSLIKTPLLFITEEYSGFMGGNNRNVGKRSRNRRVKREKEASLQSWLK